MRRTPWTGIGSLPLSDWDAAVDHVVIAYPDLPFLPEIDDGTDETFLSVVVPHAWRRRPSRQDLHLAADPSSPASFTALLDGSAPDDAAWMTRLERGLEAARRRAPLIRHWKTQIAGPVTLACLSRDDHGRPLLAEHDYLSALMRWVLRLAEAAVTLAESRSLELTIWIDEPSLGLVRDDSPRSAAVSVLSELAAQLRRGCRTGLHCCSSPPFDLLDRARFDDFSFDLLRYADAAAAATTALIAHLERGGRLALGVVAPRAIEGVDAREAIAALRAAIGRQGWEVVPQRDLLLTPTCGTLLLPFERERAMADELARLARAVDEVQR